MKFQDCGLSTAMIARYRHGRASIIGHPAGMVLYLTLEVQIMRTITTQEQAAVAGGIDSVNVPAKKKDDGAAMATLQMSIGNSGANSAGSAGSAGGGGKQTTMTCVDTVTQVSQTGGPSEMSFGVQGVSLKQVPRIESVIKTSKCTSVTTRSSQ